MAEPRILQIAHDHPAFTPGGTEWIAHDLTRTREARGVAATLLAAATALSRPQAAPGTLGRMGPDWLLQTGRYDAFSMVRADGPNWTASLERVLAETRPDIVHFHGLDRLGVEMVAFVRAHRPGTRIVLTLHDMLLICPREGLMVTTDGALCHRAAPDACRRCLPDLPAARHALREAHLKAALSAVDLFISPSTFLRDRFAAWGLPADRLVVVPNGVPDAEAPALPERGDRFAFFGNLAEHKGIHVLLDAAARLATGGTEVRVAIHGGFTWSAEAERARFTAALDAAHPVAQHFGPYDRAEVAGLMARTDWVVVPSTWWENAPLVVLEAQRARRPVICSGIGGMAELVADGVTGLHVPPGDAAALAETMAEAADPELCIRLARRIEAPATLERMADAHLDLYRKLSARVPA
jgi:glycosyltransferase involved in cell wall biosynthesis